MNQAEQEELKKLMQEAMAERSSASNTEEKRREFIETLMDEREERKRLYQTVRAEIIKWGIVGLLGGMLSLTAYYAKYILKIG